MRVNLWSVIGLLLLPVFAQAVQVQYRLDTGKVTGISETTIPAVSGYGVLVDPVIPTLPGCTQPPPSALVYTGTVLEVRSDWGCFDGTYVHSKAQLDRILQEKLENLSTQMQALQFIVSIIQSQCITPSTGAAITSTACTELRQKAAAIGPTANAVNNQLDAYLALRSTLP